MKPDIFSPIAALKAFLAATPETNQLLMSRAAWESVKEEAIRMLSPCQIMDIQGGERSFNGVTVVLYGENSNREDHQHRGPTQGETTGAPA